ncbi:hypothetical protein CD137_00205 [Staphylococcus petrasii]|nr:hypothetical protein A6V38_16400 [Staphylococcus aureus]PNZ33416.1 hypothetical protein CD137_00205 [Staphylococcus petrasii]PNZ80083.1 hypothetical protein CD140_12195 [Staphylococcus hominis subsp. novobiosepticus]
MNNKTKNKETNKLINLIILISIIDLDHTHLFITHTYTLATRLYIALLCYLATLCTHTYTCMTMLSLYTHIHIYILYTHTYTHIHTYIYT